jgi:hypothetical protein
MNRRKVVASRPGCKLWQREGKRDLPMFAIICSSFRWMTGLNHAKNPLEIAGGGGS